jgi:hypothetical protein
MGTKKFKSKLVHQIVGQVWSVGSKVDNFTKETKFFTKIVTDNEMLKVSLGKDMQVYAQIRQLKGSYVLITLGMFIDHDRRETYYFLDKQSPNPIHLLDASDIEQEEDGFPSLGNVSGGSKTSSPSALDIEGDDDDVPFGLGKAKSVEPATDAKPVEPATDAKPVEPATDAKPAKRSGFGFGN